MELALGRREQTFAWLNQFRRLRVRYEKRPDIHDALLAIACALICWGFLSRRSGVLTRAGLRYLGNNKRFWERSICRLVWSKAGLL